MEFKDYIKQEILKINENNDDDQMVGIAIADQKFKYHNECSAQFYDDYFIVKDGSVELAIPYDKVLFIQPVQWSKVKSSFDEMLGDMESFFKKIIDEDDDEEDD